MLISYLGRYPSILRTSLLDVHLVTYLGVRASNAKNKCFPFEIKYMDSYLVSAKYPHPSVVEEDVLN